MTSGASKNLFLAICAIAVLAGTPFLGMSPISPKALLISGNPDAAIFWNMRLPRTLGAFLAGSGLALGGLIFQTMFRNPLATPFTLGISSGAALGASIYFRFGTAFAFLGLAGALISSLLGCLLSMLMVYIITRARQGFSTTVMLLAGVIINFFFSSLVMFVQYSSNAYDSMQIMRWLMGTVSGMEMPMILELFVIVSCAGFLAMRLCPEFELLTAGEELAASRGVNVDRVKLYSFIIASVVVGAIVSITGPIGFVGIMAPQICRLWLGWRMSELLPASLLVGGIFLVLCDLMARTLLAPTELPIGIVTSFLGAPFFLWMLFRSNNIGELT